PEQWATAVGIVAALFNAGSLTDGAPVARVEVMTSGGEVLSFPLRAGDDLSEWAYARGNNRMAIRHRPATPFEDVSIEGNRGRWYLARVELPERQQVRAVRITATATA